VNILQLYPRLNYEYGIKDILYSLVGIFKKKAGTEFLQTLFGTQHIYFVNHARTGLRLVLGSLQLPSNAKIGVQVYNCQTVFNAIRLAGFQPIFIDVNNDFRICIDDLERKKDRIDALLLTYTFGIPSEIDKIKEIILNKPIIEDCAHAFLSKYQGQLLGTLGDAAIFSIGKGKFPSIGDGGFVIINNEKVVNRFKSNFYKLHTSGMISELKNVLKSFILNFLHKPFVYAHLTNKVLRNSIEKRNAVRKLDYRETNILKSNSYLFLKKWGYIKQNLENQKFNFSEILNAYYHDDVPGIFNDHSLFLNGFMVPVLNKKAEEIKKDFKSCGFEIGRHFARSINWAEEFGYMKGSCPNAEKIVREVLVFPSYLNYKVSKKLVEILQA
jgi:perosamine synthetase